MANQHHDGHCLSNELDLDFDLLECVLLDPEGIFYGLTSYGLMFVTGSCSPSTCPPW